MGDIYDSGYNGRLVAMSGLIGGEFKGRHLYECRVDITTTGKQAIQAAPEREFLLVENTGTVDVIFALSEADLTDHYMILAPYGSLLFNKEMPWFDAIYARVAAGTGYLTYWSCKVHR